MRTGPRNLITDVAGLRVGNAEDHHIKTGTTVLVAARPFRASVDVMGGSPGTRETDLLSPERLVDGVDGLVLSGGSAYGLDAASGVSDGLRAMGRGFVYADLTIPIVPAAILFDLAGGGDKNWNTNPYRELGVRALAAASEDFAIGTFGAGVGATAAGLKGGLGSASLLLPTGHMVGALVGANPTGSVTVGDTGHFWAAQWEIGDEFGALGPYAAPVDLALAARTKREFLAATGNTVIAIVATDADLTKTQLKRFAVAAQDGIARAVSPSHTLVDGDLIFSISTGAKPIADPLFDAIALGHAAAVCLARAIARAAYLATPAPGDLFPTWQQRFGRR